jgi:predicted RNase H-like HicB family nuclease
VGGGLVPALPPAVGGGSSSTPDNCANCGLTSSAPVVRVATADSAEYASVVADAGKIAICRLLAIIRRGQSVPGAWVAECVPLDIATQGDSLEHAMAMLVDAVDLVVDDDLERGVDPLSSRSPSPEALEELNWLLRGPLMPVDVNSVDQSVQVVLAMIDVVRPVVPAMRTEPPPRARYEPIGASDQNPPCHAAA